MSYATEKLLTSSEKNFLTAIESAEIVSTWANVSGNIYKTNFVLSDKIQEYVTKISYDGNFLVLAGSLSVTNGQYYFDWDNKDIYINVGSDPANYTIVVFFNIHFATKSLNTHREVGNSSTEVIFFEPRIISASLPQINNEDYIRFGTQSGSMTLINADGALYRYKNYRNKTVKIWHIINNITNYKLIYNGKIDAFDIDDQVLTVSYRNNDYIFNQEYNSYFSTGADTTKGFFNLSDFPLLDPNFDGYCIRYVYGVSDDIIPINIDFSDTPATNNNRDYVVRAEGSSTHSLSYTVQGGSTTTKVYLPSGHFIQNGDAIKVDVAVGNKYTFVTNRGANFVDISPAIGAPSGGEAVTRSTIGYIKIKDQDGNLYNLAFDRDYTEQTFANNTLGFTLADNFEANHSPITLFDPASMQIICRCYGKKHGSVNDTQYGNMTAANYILTNLMIDNIGLTTNEVAQANIESLSTQALGFIIPEDNATVFPTYRDIITSINRSILGNIYIDSEQKINYYLIAPLAASVGELTDKNLFEISFSYDPQEIYNFIKVFYYRKENVNASNQASHKIETSFSDIATYLHETESIFEVYTYILKTTDAQTIANRYKILYEDWKETITIKTYTRFFENLINEVLTLRRSKIIGYNKATSLNSIDAAVKSIKKDISGVEMALNSQINIENKSGSW